MTPLAKVFFDHLFGCVPDEFRSVTIEWFNGKKTVDLSEVWEGIGDDLTQDEQSLAMTLQMTIAIDAVVIEAEKYRQLKTLLKD